MLKFISKHIISIKYIICFALLLPLATCSVLAANPDENPSKDLLGNVMDTAQKHGLLLLNDKLNSPNSAGKAIFEGSTEVDINTSGVSASANGSIIVKITKILLSIVVAISVTMVLYNGLQYIVKMSSGEDGNKSLINNMIFIVVGILVALFSVTIITLLQSIPNTLEQDLTAIDAESAIE